jgi:DnaJ-class molecular chaperone
MKARVIARLIPVLALLAFFAYATSSSGDEKVSPSKEVDQYIQLLRDKDPKVRTQAAITLGNIAKSIQSSLERALIDEDPGVRSAVAAAMEARPHRPGAADAPRLEICKNCNGSGRVQETEKCTKCGGSGELKCTYCNGTGKRLFDDKKCAYCNGAGKTTCPGVRAPFGPGYCIGTRVVDHICMACKGEGKIDLSKK